MLSPGFLWSTERGEWRGQTNLSPGRPNSTPDWHSSPPVCSMCVCVGKEGEGRGGTRNLLREGPHAVFKPLTRVDLSRPCNHELRMVTGSLWAWVTFVPPLFVLFWLDNPNSWQKEVDHHLDLDESRLQLRCSVPSPHPVNEATEALYLLVYTWMTWTLVCSELEWSQLLKSVCTWQLLWRPLAVWCTVAPSSTSLSKLIGPESHDSQTTNLPLCFETCFSREHTS